MKKFILVLTFILLACGVFRSRAQDFRFGVKGAFYSTWLFNNNIADQGEAIDYTATFRPTFGITNILYFTESVGVSLDLLYCDNSQNFIGTFLGEATVSVKYLDVPVLLRLSSEGGPYVEIGPQVGFLMGEKETAVVGGFKITEEFKSDFNSLNFAAVLGFGVDIEANDNWFINIGLRFGYGINDATQQFSEAEFSNTEHGLLSVNAHYDATGDFNYHKTNRAFGGLQVGVIYKFD